MSALKNVALLSEMARKSTPIPKKIKLQVGKNPQRWLIDPYSKRGDKSHNDVLHFILKLYIFRGSETTISLLN